MPSSTPLPPHLARFVHRQITAGRYRSEDEVIRAALQHWEGSLSEDPPSGSRPEGPAVGRPRRPTPVVGERWQTPGEWLAGLPASGATAPVVRRSPRGLLADLRRGLSFDDVREARDELWAGLHPGGA